MKGKISPRLREFLNAQRRAERERTSRPVWCVCPNCRTGFINHIPHVVAAARIEKKEEPE